jgi:hypothetical protein
VFDRSKPSLQAASGVRLFVITMVVLVLYIILRDLTLGGPLGELRSVTGKQLFARSVAGVAWVGLSLLNALFVGRARLRFGRCELSRYQARFVLFERPVPVVEINQEDVRGWAVTPFGVVVEVEGRWFMRRRLQPLLVPTRSDEEVALVESLLRGEEGSSA